MEVKQILTNEDLEKAFYIRKEVFVKEQNVPLEDEFDQYDYLNGECDHILVVVDEAIAGTGRIRVVDGVGKLERICILPSYRKLGLGKVIVEKLEQLAIEKGIEKVKLHGQTHAEMFYKRLGYKTASEVFMEDGIPHILMIKEFSEIRK